MGIISVLQTLEIRRPVIFPETVISSVLEPSIPRSIGSKSFSYVKTQPKVLYLPSIKTLLSGQIQSQFVFHQKGSFESKLNCHRPAQFQPF